MNARLEHTEPHGDATQQVGPQRPDTPPVKHQQHDQNGQRCAQVAPGQRPGVKQGNDHNGAQIINHGQRRQKHLERTRNTVAQQRKHSQGKGNVRRHRDAYSRLGDGAIVEREVNGRRHDDPAQRRHNGQQRMTKVG